MSPFCFSSSSRVAGIHSLQWEDNKNTAGHIATTCNDSYEDSFSVPCCCMFCKPDITLVGVPRVSPHPKARARSSCAPEATCISGTFSACLWVESCFSTQRRHRKRRRKNTNSICGAPRGIKRHASFMDSVRSVQLSKLQGNPP